MRELSPAAPRVETGVVQFGDDWPGVFIRGDDCAYYALALREALPRIPTADFAESMVIVSPLEALLELLELLAGSRVGAAQPEAAQGETRCRCEHEAIMHEPGLGCMTQGDDYGPDGCPCEAFAPEDERTQT